MGIIEEYKKASKSYMSYINTLFNFVHNWLKKKGQLIINSRLGSMVQKEPIFFSSLGLLLVSVFFGIIYMSIIFTITAAIGLLLSYLTEGEMKERINENAKLDILLLGGVLLSVASGITLMAVLPLTLFFISVSKFIFEEYNRTYK